MKESYKGVFLWLFQRISGLAILAGVTIHFYYMHYSGHIEGHEQTEYEMVIKRLADPYWITFDLVFLLSLIYHGFNGMWGIALEYIKPPKLLKFFRTLIVGAACLLIIVGIYIITL